MCPTYKQVFPYLLLALLLTAGMFGQPQLPPKKILFAERVGEPITIDGELSEDVWQTAEAGTDFVMYAPDNGRPISPTKNTIVKVLYDDEALYVAAMMYDDEPHLMLHEVTQRDNFGSAENFGIFLNGFNDGQQDFRFFVSSAGVQMDCLMTEATGEDFTWDAIWDSSVKITDFGWVAELRIPYAALRFSKLPEQVWGVNFYREHRRDRQQYTWNHIDTQIGAEVTQNGLLKGIQNIKPPVRLFFIPYSSYYYGNDPTGVSHTFKAGMDIKYGINDSFTLDAILVPDFGQTRFDNVILNLGPFEQQFAENRPFFTEGTDLFNKGNLLYTRRIGGSPSTFAYSADPDVVIENPATVNLINALKVSGRTKDGLGIGVLNAVTERTYAESRNSVTGERRDILVEPLANFNVLVVDKRFNQNSSVSFVNTNVTRDGEFRDANVSALVFDLNTKANTYKMAGDFKYSHINEFGDNPNRMGYSTSLSLSETAGNYRYGAGGQYVSTDYDPNDLGINFITHYHAAWLNGSYRIINPTKTFNTFVLTSEIYSEFDNFTGRAQAANLSFNLNSTNKKNDYIGAAFNINPLETYDFYEPRYEGRFLYVPDNYYAYVYLSTNYNRKFAIDIQPMMTLWGEDKRERWYLNVTPRYRFTDRITGILAFTFDRLNANVGYIDDTYTDDATPFDIYMARRDRTTYTLTFGGKYSLNKDMTINLNSRYYWSYAENREFYTLTNDGYLTPANYTQNANSNFSTWNFDLNYSWWFAPGSQVSVLYRNSNFLSTREIDKDINRNISDLFQENLSHVFSISVRYFIDYNRARKWF